VSRTLPKIAWSSFLGTPGDPLEPALFIFLLSLLYSSRKSLSSSSSNLSGSASIILLELSSSRSTTELVSWSEEESKSFFNLSPNWSNVCLKTYNCSFYSGAGSSCNIWRNLLLSSFGDYKLRF